MKLYIKKSFCNTFENNISKEYIKTLYEQYDILFREGYRKLEVQEQCISLTEYMANELFNIWPDLDICYVKSKIGSELELNINGIKDINENKND